MVWWLGSLVASAQDAGTVTGAFGKGLTLRNADDTLSMQIRGRVQTRASVWAYAPDSGEEPVSEIAIRRMRMTFAGHAMTKDLTYYVQLAFSNQDTESDLRLPLRDAYVNYAWARDLELRVGQGKVPFGRQRVTSSGSLELPDRSITVAELNLDRDVGVSALSKDLGGAGGRFGYAVGLFGGDGRNRLGERFGYLAAGRIVLRPMGEFDDNVEADLTRDPRARLSIAASLGYNADTDRPRSTLSEPFEFATFDYLHAGGDAMLKVGGFCGQAELLLRRANQDVVDTGGVLEYSRSGYGWYVQAGQMLTEHVELVARYGDLVPAPGTDPEFVRARELGGGPSYYFDGHNLKLQADYFYLPTGDSFDGGAHQVRTQLQLWL
ncbi:MAG: porin [Myxococcota bacterium]